MYVLLCLNLFFLSLFFFFFFFCEALKLISCLLVAEEEVPWRFGGDFKEAETDLSREQTEGRVWSAAGFYRLIAPLGRLTL